MLTSLIYIILGHLNLVKIIPNTCDLTRSLVLWECFADHCCPFVLFLLAIVLSVLRRYTDSDDTVISSNSSYIKLSNNKSISIKAFVAYNFRRARVFFYVICVCLRNVVSNTYGFVVFFTLCTLCCQFAFNNKQRNSH
jgi:hypothetical protein